MMGDREEGEVITHVMPSHDSRLLHILHLQRQQRQFCDLTLITGDTSLSLHLCMLASFSSRIVPLLASEANCSSEALAENLGFQGYAVNVECEHDALEVVVTALYTGVLEVSKNSFEKVVQAIEFLEISDLLDLISDAPQAIQDTNMFDDVLSPPAHLSLKKKSLKTGPKVVDGSSNSFGNNLLLPNWEVTPLKKQGLLTDNLTLNLAIVKTETCDNSTTTGGGVSSHSELEQVSSITKSLLQGGSDITLVNVATMPPLTRSPSSRRRKKGTPVRVKADSNVKSGSHSERMEQIREQMLNKIKSIKFKEDIETDDGAESTESKQMGYDLDYDPSSSTEQPKVRLFFSVIIF